MNQLLTCALVVAAVSVAAAPVVISHRTSSDAVDGASRGPSTHDKFTFSECARTASTTVGGKTLHLNFLASGKEGCIYNIVGKDNLVAKTMRKKGAHFPLQEAEGLRKISQLHAMSDDGNVAIMDKVNGKRIDQTREWKRYFGHSELLDMGHSTWVTEYARSGPDMVPGEAGWQDCRALVERAAAAYADKVEYHAKHHGIYHRDSHWANVLVEESYEPVEVNGKPVYNDDGSVAMEYVWKSFNIIDWGHYTLVGPGAAEEARRLSERGAKVDAISEFSKGDWFHLWDWLRWESQLPVDDAESPRLSQGVCYSEKRENGEAYVSPWWTGL